MTASKMTVVLLLSCMALTAHATIEEVQLHRYVVTIKPGSRDLWEPGGAADVAWKNHLTGIMDEESWQMGFSHVWDTPETFVAWGIYHLAKLADPIHQGYKNPEDLDEFLATPDKSKRFRAYAREPLKGWLLAKRASSMSEKTQVLHTTFKLKPGKRDDLVAWLQQSSLHISTVAPTSLLLVHNNNNHYGERNYEFVAAGPHAVDRLKDLIKEVEHHFETVEHTHHEDGHASHNGLKTLSHVHAEL